MLRERLKDEALVAAENAKHNLALIKKYPEKMLPGSHENAEAYLGMMIRFAEYEKQNSRPARRLFVVLNNLTNSIILTNARSSKREGKLT